MAADDALTDEQQELMQLRARVRELETSQRQLEIYAEDLRRTFGELRRQLGYMNELHRISTAIGEVLEPTEVMERTLSGLDRLVANQAVCIYLVENDAAVRTACHGAVPRPGKLRQHLWPLDNPNPPKPLLAEAQ